MSHQLTKAHLIGVLQAIGDRATRPGTIYLIGGAVALWHQWRTTTVDIDMAMQPEPGGVFAAISALKRQMNVAIELVDPNQCVPALPGWQGRSHFVGRFGAVDVYLFDYYSLMLAKIERYHQRDQVDVRSMIEHNFVNRDELLRLCGQVDQVTIDKLTHLQWAKLIERIKDVFSA